jgi:hypothetical protein
MAKSQSVGTAEYTVRPAHPSDRGAFLSLYESVWGRSRSEAWFDWRFERNPYADEVEMVVAERAGRLVGAEPLLPMPLTAGSQRVEARQPVDWIVHPDHRRQGAFTRMTERLLSTYGERADLLFNFPTDALRPGLEKFDWTPVSEQTTRYRVQDLGCIAADDERAVSPTELVRRVGTPLVRAGLGAVDRLASAPDDVSVGRVDGVATDAVHAVYSQTRPDAIHVPREPAFVEWRFANPRWDTTTYVATRGGKPVSTVVVATATKPQTTVAYLLDVQPMTTVPGRGPAFAAALDAALDDLDVEAVQAPTTPYPGVLRRRGFLCDDNPLVSRFSSPATHVVRPLPAPTTERLDAGIFDDDEWLLLLGDRDIE